MTTGPVDGASPANPSEGKPAVDVALIVGVVVGGVALIAALGVIAAVVAKRRRPQTSAKAAREGPIVARADSRYGDASDVRSTAYGTTTALQIGRAHV